MSKNFFIFFVIVSVQIIQSSFIDPFTNGIPPINLNLLFLTLLAFRLNLVPLLWWSLMAGALQDLNSILPFGTFSVITIITVITLYFLLKNLLTNKSLFPFILMSVAGTIIFNSLILLASYILYSLGYEGISLYQIPRVWTGIILQSVINGLSALILFLTLRSFTKRFQNQFLVRK